LRKPQDNELHFQSLVIDAHVDTTQRLVADGFELGIRHDDGSVDIPRLRQGGVAAVFFAIWTPGTITGPAAVERAQAQFDAIHRQIAAHPKDLVLARSSADVLRARRAGQIALLIAIEGGHLINNDLAILRRYHSLGARYMTLTHTLNVDWADASTDRPLHHGLTDFGTRVIGELNRLGMLADVSHVSDKTFYDVLAASQAPVAATHSSCRARCDAPRNLSDEMLRALAAKGGVVHINFHIGFLSQTFRDAWKQCPELQEEIESFARRLCGENLACQLLETSRITRERIALGQLPHVDWTEIVEHICHAVNVAGIDHVGLGSDFDGADMPEGMEDASQLPKIARALSAKGYPVGDVQKILGGNTLRLMQDVEAIAHKMEGTT